MSPRRVAIGVLSAAGALLAVITVGGGWVYAGQLLPAPARDRTLDVTATLTEEGTVLVTAERRACLERFGLYLGDAGFVVYSGPVIAGTCDGEGVVERTIEMVTAGDPPRGVELGARFDEYVFEDDPGAVDVDVTEVDVPLPDDLGTAPAWQVDGRPGDWVIVAHGRSGTRSEALRALPTLTDSGATVLVITYRNDFAGAPSAEDAQGTFGRDESRDLTAAVEYARGEGAERIVLVGFSQGGSLVGYHVRDSGTDDLVGMILDAPLIDLPATLVQQARLRGIPDPVILPILFGTQQIAYLRAGFDVGDVHHVDALATAGVPILLFHGDEDDFVPIGPSDVLAEQGGDLVTYERVEGAGHVESWNTDAERYVTAVAAFLDRVFS